MAFPHHNLSVLIYSQNNYNPKLEPVTKRTVRYSNIKTLPSVLVAS